MLIGMLKDSIPYHIDQIETRKLNPVLDSTSFTLAKNVEIEGESISIGAEIITLSGYSAHADKLGLLNFVTRMRHKPSQVRIVHGDKGAKVALQQAFLANGINAIIAS